MSESSTNVRRRISDEFKSPASVRRVCLCSKDLCNKIDATTSMQHRCIKLVDHYFNLPKRSRAPDKRRRWLKRVLPKDKNTFKSLYNSDTRYSINAKHFLFQSLIWKQSRLFPGPTAEPYEELHRHNLNQLSRRPNFHRARVQCVCTQSDDVCGEDLIYVGLSLPLKADVREKWLTILVRDTTQRQKIKKLPVVKEGEKCKRQRSKVAHHHFRTDQLNTTANGRIRVKPGELPTFYPILEDVSDEAKRPTPDDRRDITSIRTIVASGTTNLPEKNVKKNVKNVQVRKHVVDIVTHILKTHIECAQYTSPVTPEAISIKSQSYIKLLENDNALCNTVTGEPSMACVKKLYDLLNAVASFDVMRQYSPRVRTLLVEVNFPEESEEGESGKIIESVMKEYA